MIEEDEELYQSLTARERFRLACLVGIGVEEYEAYWGKLKESRKGNRIEDEVQQ